MSYPDGIDPTSERARDRAQAREQLTAAVTGLLNQVPSLPNEGRVGNGELLHLRLMTTPQELAMLPFELANPPSGFENGGQPLLIGPTPDVVLTREVRRGCCLPGRPPPEPRVLVVFADPSESNIPAEHTLEAIGQALRPWGHPAARDGKLTMDLGDHLAVLPRASLDEIREKCATGRFTHVHILAHGAQMARPGDHNYGLALWNRSKDGEEIVDGKSLARALRPPQTDGTWASPWCVVLCTCDSGNVGGVVHPTANIAHALHVAGVPFVLASQYPLTFGAAVKLAETLYPLEFRGEDPRYILRDVRHTIATHMRNTHDWASLVAYAGWSDDVAQQLEETRITRVLAQLEAAQDWADSIIAKADYKRREKERKKDKGNTQISRQQDVDAAGDAVLTRSIDLVAAASERLEREVATKRRQLADIERRSEEITKHERQHLRGKVTALLTEIYGLLGSASKRRARLLAHKGNREEERKALEEATRWYLKGVDLQAPEHWTPCQSFVLQALSGRWDGSDGAPTDSATRNWRLARQNAERALGDRQEREWSHGTLVEVELWRPLFELGARTDEIEKAADKGADKEAQEKADKADEQAIKAATEHLRNLMSEAGADSFAVKSTLRQLWRYLEWWGEQDYIDARMKARVQRVLDNVGSKSFTIEDPERIELEIHLPDSMAAASELAKSDEVLGDGKVKTIQVDEEDADTAFSVQMLPARQGDALWVEYGDPDDPRRILIDGGFRTTMRVVESRIKKIANASPEGKCHFELGVVSHIDADHIEGLVEMIGKPFPVTFGDLWFNGRKHLDVPAVETALADQDLLGGKHGLFLDTVLELSKTRWNAAFDGGTIVAVPDKRKLPVVDLPDGMKLTIMSPTPEKLEDLAKRWDKEVRKAGLDGKNYSEVLAAMDRLHYGVGALTDALLRRKKPSGPLNLAKELKKPDGADSSPANGSSIAFLAEYAGRSCLFMADAHPDAMIAAIDQVVGPGGRLQTGAVKLSHHGSANNVTLGLLKRLDSKVFLVSTNGGGGHYHPDRSAIAKLVAGDWRPKAKSEYPIRILFNYRNEYTRIWDDEDLKKTHHYAVDYADGGDILELALVPKTPEG
jgi:beta-lactamase superfamily II metal-dependent hydrolase